MLNFGSLNPLKIELSNDKNSRISLGVSALFGKGTDHSLMAPLISQEAVATQPASQLRYYATIPLLPVQVSPRGGGGGGAVIRARMASYDPSPRIWPEWANQACDNHPPPQAEMV